MWEIEEAKLSFFWGGSSPILPAPHKHIHRPNSFQNSFKEYYILIIFVSPLFYCGKYT